MKEEEEMNLESVSSVQRYFNVGYAVAIRIQDSFINHIYIARKKQAELDAGVADKLREALKQHDDLMNESKGVYGLHLNGAPAPWDWLEQEWLSLHKTALEGTMTSKSEGEEIVYCWSCELEGKKREAMKGHGQCCSCRDNQ